MKRLAYIALCLIILLTGCATSGPSTREQASVYTALRSGNIEQALVELESMQEEYEEPVVYEADKAILTFYANRPEGSISLIAPALDTMEYNSIASFSESIEGLLVNDNVKAYAGSNYENLYLRGINALNYYLMGDAEGAAVEIRRANIISRDYQLNIEEQTNWLESLVLAFTPNPFRYLTIPEVEDYTTSAFINYLSMLMYASMGDSGNASVDYRTLQETAMDPSVVSEEDTAAPAGKSRVNFIGFTGFVATKEEVSVIAEDGGVFHKVVWPHVIDRPNADIQRVVVECSDGQGIELGVLEDVSELAKRNMAMDTSAKYLGSYYRGYTKMLAAQSAAEEAYDLAMDQLSGVNPILRSAGEKAARVAYEEALAAVDSTEIADTRMARFLPDKVWAGGMSLTPGIYDFTITYVTSEGSFTAVREDVRVANDGEPNLVVSTCLR